MVVNAIRIELSAARAALVAMMVIAVVAWYVSPEGSTDPKSVAAYVGVVAR